MGYVNSLEGTNLYHQWLILTRAARSKRCCALRLELWMLRQGCAQNAQENGYRDTWRTDPTQMPVECAALLLGCGGIREKTCFEIRNPSLNMGFVISLISESSFFHGRHMPCGCKWIKMSDMWDVCQGSAPGIRKTGRHGPWVPTFP